MEMHTGIDVANWVFLLAGLVVLGLLITGVVVLFVTLRAKAWWVVGPLLGLVLLAVMAAGVFRVWKSGAMPPTRVSFQTAAPALTDAHPASDIADGNSARPIASGQSYRNEDGSAYVEPSGMDDAASPGSGGDGGEPTSWTRLKLVLVVVGLLIAGVVALFVKLRAKAWWIFGPVLGLVLLLLPAWLLLDVRQSSSLPSRSYEATYSRTSGGNTRSDTIKVVTPGGGWNAPGPADSASADRLSETFLADVYPSAIQAAEALAANVARSFYSAPDSMSGTARTPTPGVLTPTAEAGPTQPNTPAGPLAGSADAAPLPDVEVVGKADAMILQAVAEALRKGAMARRVQVASVDAASAPASRPAASAKQVICAVRVDGEESGTVQIVLESPDRQITSAARFVSKPWAANFAQYVAGARRPVVRAESPAAASLEEAQERALADAVRQLVPYVRSALNRDEANPAVQKAVSHGAILAELRKGKMILDRFGQQFDRPYGKLWREQILVDASPQVVEPIAAGTARNISAARSAERQTWWNLVVSLGGLGVLVFAVYLVLNAATKGYYTWVLRLLAIGAIVAGVAIACIA